MPRRTRNSQASESFTLPPNDATNQRLIPASTIPNEVAPVLATVSTSVTPLASEPSSLVPPTNLVNSVVTALEGTLTRLVDAAIASRLTTCSSLPTTTATTVLVEAPPIPTPLQSTSSRESSISLPSSLPAQCNRMENLGQGQGTTFFPPASAHVSPDNPSSQGRLVPSFINTFSAPLVAPGSAVSMTSTPPSLSSVLAASSLPNNAMSASPFVFGHPSSLQMPFVIGPGYAPVPFKIVSMITSGKFVNLGDLLPENALTEENEPQLLLDGRLVLTGSTKKPRREIVDIVSWLEAFTVFSMVLTSHFPHRWKDVSAYKLLILRTFRQFQGKAWLHYDKAFRQHAAATNLLDWSLINVQLFNFNTAGASVRSPDPRLPPTTFEAQGNLHNPVICSSWNRGRCIAQSSTCRFSHICSKCSDKHRSIECTAAVIPNQGIEQPKRKKSRY